MMIKKILVALGGAVAVLVSLTSAASAQTALPAVGGAQYCVAHLQTQQTACAASEAQAVQLAGISPQAVLAVVLYDGINYTSPMYNFYVTAPCTPAYDGEYGNPNLGTYSNRASSVRTYNQCDVHLHDPINYGSPYSTWIDASANLANIGTGWSNRASSIGVS